MIETVMLIIWIVIALISLIVELASPQLLSIWFTVAAVISLILNILHVHYAIQIAVFVVVSVLSFIIMRKLIKKFGHEDDTATNAERLIGKVAVVTKAINLNERGEVKIMGQLWSAISHEEMSIDEKVVIVGFEGNKVIVEKIATYEIK